MVNAAFDQALRNRIPAPFVAAPSLLASMHPTYGQHVRLVEVRDRFFVLALLVLDDEAVAAIESVDRQPPAAPVLPWVTDEPLERMLRRRACSTASRPSGASPRSRRRSLPRIRSLCLD